MSRADSSKLKLEYSYAPTIDGVPDPTKNNGDVSSQRISVPAEGTAPAQTFTQAYAYDALDRLEAASEESAANTIWSQGYSYDRFGNRNLIESESKMPDASGILSSAVSDSNRAILNPAINGATNRVAEPGYGYDKMGNQTCDPRHPCSTDPTSAPYYDYDGDNKLVAAGGGAPTGAEYVYDGGGQRVKKVVGTTTTVFVYDVGGKLTAEYPNKQSLPQTTPTSYITADQLGSTRAVMGQNGETKARYDYLPFGEELYASRPGYVGDNITRKFTGKERDAETRLDYFMARYYGPEQGRFLSVDPENYQARQTPGDPQSWHGYSYVKNKPIRLVDRDGKDTLEDLSNIILKIITVSVRIGYIKAQEQFNARVEHDRAFLLSLQKDAKAEGSDLIIQNLSNQMVRVGDPAKMDSIHVILWADRVREIFAEGGRLEELPPGTAIINGAQYLGTVVYRGGPNLTPRNIDVKIKEGLVQPDRGVSVNADPSGLEKFGGAYKIESLPDELKLIQWGRDPNHFEIVPREPMTLERFTELLNQIKLIPPGK